jgi:hypothetical protein
MVINLCVCSENFSFLIKYTHRVTHSIVLCFKNTLFLSDMQTHAHTQSIDVNWINLIKLCAAWYENFDGASREVGEFYKLQTLQKLRENTWNIQFKCHDFSFSEVIYFYLNFCLFSSVYIIKS